MYLLRTPCFHSNSEHQCWQGKLGAFLATEKEQWSKSQRCKHNYHDHYRLVWKNDLTLWSLLVLSPLLQMSEFSVISNSDAYSGMWDGRQTYCLVCPCVFSMTSQC